MHSTLWFAPIDIVCALLRTYLDDLDGDRECSFTSPAPPEDFGQILSYYESPLISDHSSDNSSVLEVFWETSDVKSETLTTPSCSTASFTNLAEEVNIYLIRLELTTNLCERSCLGSR